MEEKENSNFEAGPCDEVQRDVQQMRSVGGGRGDTRFRDGDGSTHDQLHQVWAGCRLTFKATF